MKLKVLFHDSCFDGAASAAVFTRFFLERVDPKAEVSFAGLQHQAGAQPIAESHFTGDQNAIVDFRYSQSEKLTWWFDHHQSAFQRAGDEDHFRSDRSGRKFHDPTRKSCTKYLAEIAQGRFGFDPSPLDELIEWGELIDGALFPSPRMAVELAEPALQIMTVLEAASGPELIPQVISEMQHKKLAEIAAHPRIREPFEALFAKHQRSIEVVRKKIQLEKGVLFFDVGDEGLDSLNKFIAYYLHPEAQYTVWVGKGPKRAKVSIGCNPWKPEGRRHDLSKIAERHGGGGHPVVAAMSFGPDELPRARQVAAEIVAELRA